jgi:hypothetical protein
MSRFQTTRAGFPTTTVFGGTLVMATAPAPTTEFSLTDTPFKTMASAHIQALEPM